MKTNQSTFKLLYPLLLAAMMASGVASATQSSSTLAVVGHSPIVENVNISPLTPTLGQELSVSYDYNDVDGDAEASSIKWLYNGTVVAGQTAKQFTPVLKNEVGYACADFQVTAEVTPKSLTGDPKTGMTKVSAPVTVLLNLPIIPGYTFPETAVKNWSQAEAYCVALGGRLPSRAELQAVFNTYTSGGTNDQLAEKYGWPMFGGRCGGTYTDYWTGDRYGSGGHYVIYMDTGGVGFTSNNSLSQVTCVR